MWAARITAGASRSPSASESRGAGAVIQSAGDGFSDGHNVFMQVPEVRQQWSCFLASAVAGEAIIAAPAAPGTPCPR